jgi:hypothetical protein
METLMSDTDSFRWNGGTVGSWGTASNWIDLTTGSAAAAAPDYNSTVTIGPGVTLLGYGQAASLTALGDVTIAGDFDAAATLTGDGDMILGGGPGFISFSGGLTLNPGQTLSGTGEQGGTLIDNGAIVTSGNLGLGEPFIDAGGVPGRPYTYVEFVGSLSGTGSVEVQSGGTIAVDEPVTSSVLTFQLDGNANLTIEAPIPAGITIELVGSADTVAIDGGSYLAEHPPETVGGHEYYTGGEPPIGASIAGFDATDSIAFADEWQLGLTLTAVAFNDGTLSMMQGSTVVSTVGLLGDYSQDTFVLGAPVTTGLTTQQAITLEPSAALCFVAGTLITTPGGAVPVERLAIGDLVLTAGGRVRPISWIGAGRVLATRGRRSAATPVIVRKGALAPNVPHADMHVTKGHSLFIDGVLIPVEFLVNHRSIRWDDQAQEVSLYHIELETHDILLANGAPAESYRDDGNRWLFQNANTGWDQPPKPPCAPVLTDGPVVDAVWRRLLDRAGPRAAVPMTADADLHVRVDGVRVDATCRTGDVLVFDLPAHRRGVRIVSRAAAPQELGIARDPRCLGVAVRRVALRQATRFRVFEAGDGLLTDGFYPLEAARGIQWTDGDAALPDEMFAGFTGPLEVVIQAGGSTLYRADCRPSRIA